MRMSPYPYRHNKAGPFYFFADEWMSNSYYIGQKRIKSTVRLTNHTKKQKKSAGFSLCAHLQEGLRYAMIIAHSRVEKQALSV